MAANQRAYAFILCNRENGHRLLAFRQKGIAPAKAFHLPGGGVERAETPTDGVIREIEEESGLVGLVPEKYIGQAVEQGRTQVIQRHFFLFRAPESLPESWDHKVTGTGEDAGITYRYSWLPTTKLLRIHKVYHAFLNSRHLPDLFPKDIHLGLKREDLYLLPYSPKWPPIFEAERDIIKVGIGKWVTDIQHVGSTAIPDFAAKPIIDIAIALKDRFETGVLVDPLYRLGYVHKGPNGVPGRQYFTKKLDGRTAFHLHMYHHSSIFYKRHLIFRDALRKDDALAVEYHNLKLKLWKEFPSERAFYTAGKNPFFQEFFKHFG